MASSILNSDNGVVSGSSGLKTTGGDDGSLKIQNNGVDAITISAAGVATFANPPSGIPAPDALSTASGSAPSYSARAWVNFNGTGTVSIRASGNVSSITDRASGRYTVNFTTGMPDANYATVVGGNKPDPNEDGFVWASTGTTSLFQTASGATISTAGGGNYPVDLPQVSVAIFR